MRFLESVPNVSEGRDPVVIAAIAAAFGAGAHLLDVHSDGDHHRSVYTLVGDDAGLADALVSGIARARDLIDLRSHDGIHPRIGATDVVPVVPLDAGATELARADAVARTVGRRVGEELGLPVFLYAESGGGRRPSFFRRGGPEELQRRIDRGELDPDYGPRRLDPRAGAVLVGARAPLVALNIELANGNIEDARAIAAAVRESSGGMPGVQALGLELERSGVIQVSVNVIEVDRAPPADVVARIRAEASARGVELGRSELVGLLPERCAAPPEALGLDGLPDDLVLERRLASL